MTLLLVCAIANIWVWNGGWPCTTPGAGSKISKMASLAVDGRIGQINCLSRFHRCRQLSLRGQ